MDPFRFSEFDRGYGSCPLALGLRFLSFFLYSFVRSIRTKQYYEYSVRSKYCMYQVELRRCAFIFKLAVLISSWNRLFDNPPPPPLPLQSTSGAQRRAAAPLSECRGRGLYRYMRARGIGLGHRGHRGTGHRVLVLGLVGSEA